MRSPAADRAQQAAETIASAARSVSNYHPYGDWEVRRWLNLALGEPDPGPLPGPPIKDGKVNQSIVREIQYAALDNVFRRIWQRKRIVYDIDADLYAELGSTERDTELPLGLTEKLPHPDPYIAFPDPLISKLSDGKLLRTEGFFVVGRGAGRPVANRPVGEVVGPDLICSTHTPGASGDLILLIGGPVVTADGKPVEGYRDRVSGKMIPDQIWNRVTLELGAREGRRSVTLGELVDGISSRFDRASYSITRWESTERMITSAVSTLVYLCASNAELKPLPARPAQRKGSGKAAGAKPAKVYRVGYEAGARMRAWRRANVGQQRGPGAGGTKKPHMRRSHPHLYWTGKGRMVPEVKWIEPTPVKMGKAPDVPTVVGVGKDARGE